MTDEVYELENGERMLRLRGLRSRLAALTSADDDTKAAAQAIRVTPPLKTMCLGDWPTCGRSGSGWRCIETRQRARRTCYSEVRQCLSTAGMMYSGTGAGNGV
jgi:hypothetical protein